MKLHSLRPRAFGLRTWIAVAAACVAGLCLAAWVESAERTEPAETVSSRADIERSRGVVLVDVYADF